MIKKRLSAIHLDAWYINEILNSRCMDGPGTTHAHNFSANTLSTSEIARGS